MVELIPKQGPAFPRWFTGLFYAAIFLLIASIAGYFLLNHFVKDSQEKFQSLKLELVKLETSENLKLEEEMLSYQKKINDFSSIKEKHLQTSQFFKFLEGVTHPKVSFKSCNLNAQNSRVNLSGVTSNFEKLGQQLLILKDNSSVRKTELKKVSLSEGGGVDFTLSFTFKPSLIR